VEILRPSAEGLRMTGDRELEEDFLRLPLFVCGVEVEHTEEVAFSGVGAAAVIRRRIRRKVNVCAVLYQFRSALADNHCCPI